LGKLPQSQTLLSAALDIAPDNPDSISELAVVIFHLGDKFLALKELDRCVVLEPKNPYRYSSRAYIKSNMRMIYEAIEDYEICVELDPDDPIAYNNLGLLLETKGKMTAAKRNFSKADELEGILKERGVSLPEQVENKSTVEKENEQSTKEPQIDSVKEDSKRWQIAKKVFTRKSVFKEY